MKVMVVGVLALASALVREPDEGLRAWRSQNNEPQAVLLPQLAEDDIGGSAAPSLTRDDRSAEAADAVGPTSASAPVVADAPDVASDSSSAPGHWEIACEIKNGSALVFDRASLREYGPVTLFRWSAPTSRAARPGERIFTAVVNCREKTIEASWPGRSRETYAGTCGRGLLDAVCAASESAAASGRSHVTVPPRAPHGSAGTSPHR